MQLRGATGTLYTTGSNNAVSDEYVLHLDRRSNLGAETARHRINQIMNIRVSDVVRQNLSWPIDILSDDQGRYRGYVSTALPAGRTLRNILFNDSTSLNYRQQLAIARNLCVAVQIAHLNGLICGNLTLDNVIVNPLDARVMLAGTIRFQLSTASDAPLLCTHATSEYLAPELQMSRCVFDPDLASARPFSLFSTSTDSFSLAVILYALFSRGEHPYNFTLNGERCISSLGERLASSPAPRSLPAMTQPLPSLSFISKTYPLPSYKRAWTHLPHALTSYFNRAFDIEHHRVEERPTVAQWIELFDKLQHSLRAALTSPGRQNVPQARAQSSGTPTETRQELGNEYSDGRVSSSSYTQPRVFWRTALLVAIGCSALGLLSILDQHGTLLGSIAGNGEAGAPLSAIILTVACPLVAMACLGVIARHTTARQGYKLRHYIESGFATLAGTVLPLMAYALLAITTGAV